MKEILLMGKGMELECNFSPSQLKGLCTVENGRRVLLEFNNRQNDYRHGFGSAEWPDGSFFQGKWEMGYH